MTTVWIKEFTGGLDTRRLPETTPGGVLIEAQDGHITRGGEFDQRAAFVEEFNLPAGTVGLAYSGNFLVVFGSGPTPAGLPAGVLYQQLTIPSGSPVVRVLSFDQYAGKIYVAAQVADGGVIHFHDGVYVPDWYDGRARATFDIVTGATDATIRVFVNGVAVSGVVPWAGTSTATATALAASITALTSTPEFTAVADGTRVVLLASTTGPTPNGQPVAFTLAGGMDVSTPGGSTTTLSMQGGVSPENTYQPGDFVKTIGTKMYALSGPNMHFSGIKAPTKWTTSTVGAGFIDMSSETSGSEELVSVAKYQSAIAVFAERVIQIWYVDPDPALNKQTQVLNNTGTASARSVTQFGDNDLFYLDASGLRSLRARDASNSAATTDIGIPVDTLVIEAMRGLTDIERSRVFGLIEPRDGRFWLTIKDKIFVFSYFPGSKVSAWSTYSPGFVIEEAVAFNRRVYLRSGNTIYVYGGLAEDPIHDDTPAIARLPLLDAGSPTAKKTLTGFDVALQGRWELRVSTQPTNIDASDLIATFEETTFNLDRIPASGQSTHFGVTMTSKGVGPHRLGSIAIHFEGGKDAT